MVLQRIGNRQESSGEYIDVYELRVETDGKSVRTQDLLAAIRGSRSFQEALEVLGPTARVAITSGTENAVLQVMAVQTRPEAPALIVIAQEDGGAE